MDWKYSPHLSYQREAVLAVQTMQDLAKTQPGPAADLLCALLCASASSCTKEVGSISPPRRGAGRTQCNRQPLQCMGSVLHCWADRAEPVPTPHGCVEKQEQRALCLGSLNWPSDAHLRSCLHDQPRSASPPLWCVFTTLLPWIPSASLSGRQHF